MRQRLSRGLVQVYTGNSKGKSTAAFGLALRAIGHGFKVYIIQFMKGSSYYGELAAWHRLYPYIQFSQYGRSCPYSHLIRQGEDTCRGCGQCFVKKGEATAEDRKQAAMALEKARKVMKSDEFDIIILDEVLNAIYFELISTNEVLELINEKPEMIELVLTGRNAPAELIEAAHLVTEMKEIKHPYQQGIPARRGIEY